MHKTHTYICVASVKEFEREQGRGTWEVLEGGNWRRNDFIILESQKSLKINI